MINNEKKNEEDHMREFNKKFAEKPFLAKAPESPPICVICLKNTNGFCGEDWVCTDCFVSGAYRKWLEKKAA